MPEFHTASRGRWLRLAALVCIWLAPAGAALAQDVLIFRTGADLETEYTKPNIVFQVRVSAFAPIRAVRINGQAVTTAKGTFVNISQPLQLVPGENRIIVEATTEFETARQEFVLNLKLAVEGKPDAGRARRGFQFIGLLGGQYSSNPAKVSNTDAAIAGTRAFLVAIPRYDFSVRDSRLRLQSIVSRDRYDVKDLADLEVAFTQVTLSLLLGERRPSVTTLGLGYNYIDQRYRSLLKGKVHLEDDSFVFAGYERVFGRNSSWNLGLELKNQNLTEQSPDPDREQDASVKTLTGSLVLGLGFVQAKTKFGYSATDAVGKLKDQTTTRLNLEFSVPIGSLIPSLGVRVKRIAYKEVDPLLGDKPDTTLVSPVLTVNYQFSSRWLLMVELLNDTQTSKVPSLVYRNQSYMVALAFVY